MFYVFYTTSKQKQIREKVISLSKMSVRDVPPNQNFKLVLRKKILLECLLWLFLEESAFILLEDAYLAPNAKLLILCTAVLQGSIS